MQLLNSKASVDALIARARRRQSLPTPALRRHLRKRLGLTQDELASALNISRVAVCRYEAGTREPRRGIRERYAELLDRLAREGVAS